MMNMSHAIGVAVAFAVAVLGRSAGLDRDRAFYSTVLIVTASYYVLFAVLGGSMHAVAVESIGLAVFTACAVVGFRTSMWLVVAGLMAHGVFDIVHARTVSNPGMPEYWPAFCLAFDVAAAVWLGWLSLKRSSRRRRPGAFVPPSHA